MTAFAGDEPIAIVGMAGIFPRATSARHFWRNILGKVDAVDHAPTDWGAEGLLDPSSSANDRIYTDKGGFLGDLAVFDPLKHGVMPNSVDGGEPDQFLALQVAAEAVSDAGLDARPVAGDRVAVILGRGTYINRGFTTVVQHGLMIDRFLQILQQLNPDTTKESLAELKSKLKASLPPFNASMAPALVPNLVAGRIANRLDFRGASYIIDAACASSLIAVERGMADLRAGRIDMAVVGGVHASTPPPIYQIFCQLEALSRKGIIRPFSAEADGTLLAEGVGILCLKRVSDAEAAGDRIYAVLRAIGVASDGKGLGILAPRPEGEELALHHAYADSGIDPAPIGLVEAHGTATSVGDRTEIESLAVQFGPRQGKAADIALGSVKSMIGHCLPASGAASLIKTALALHHRVLPPMLVDTPNPALNLESSRFYLNSEARPWVHGLATPRRAGVNAFGFGGINAHAILEEYIPSDASENADVLPPAVLAPPPEIDRPTEAILCAGKDAAGLTADLDGLIAALSAPDADLSGIARLRAEDWRASSAQGDLPGDWRAAVVAGTVYQAIAQARRIAEQIAAGKARLRDRKGLYFGKEPHGGKLAFVFPGEGSQSAGMLRNLMLHVPAMRGWFDLAESAFADHPRGLGPTQALIAAETASEALWRMDIGPELIFAANQSVAGLYRLLGLTPDMLVGHSTGEYSALYAAGVTRRTSARVLKSEMRALNALYERLESEGAIADGYLITLGAIDRVALHARVAGRKDLFVAMDNCPNQQVLAATTQAARDDALALAEELGGLADALPFARAYHSPAFASFGKALRHFLSGLDFAPPELPVYSCLTTEPIPADVETIRDLAAGQWSAAVRFTETIRRMHDDGARIFLECGPRNNLTAFVGDILRDRPHLALAVDTPGRSGLEQLHHFVAQLWIAGICPDPKGFAAPAQTASAPSRRPTVLKMGLQPMKLANTDGLQKSKATGIATPLAPLPRSQPEAAPKAVPVATPVARAVSPDLVDAGAIAVLALSPQATAAPDPTSAPMSAPMSGWFAMMDQFLVQERELMSAYFSGTVASQAAGAQGLATPSAAPGDRFALLDGITRAPDGQSLVATMTVDAERMPYLKDHCFGRNLSRVEPQLTGLPVVPLTFSIEALAEAAGALCPELVVTAMTELRTSRWLALDLGALNLELDAQVRSRTADQAQVHVRLREAVRPGGPALRPILIEAGVELARTRQPAPIPAGEPEPGLTVVVDPAMAARWDRASVYQKIMFHGPTLQAVSRMDEATPMRVSGILDGMLGNQLLACSPAPAFETDAVTLDAVGQLVGTWAAELLPEAFHIFPFRMERLDIYRAPLASGTAARCSGTVELRGSDEIRSDLEVIEADGRVNLRVTGWWDKRFVLPDRFFRARLAPAQNPLSQILDLSALPVQLPDGIALALTGEPDAGLLEGSGGIWEKVLAHLILSSAEREAAWFGADPGQTPIALAGPARRHDWLRGRAAAKDALRALSGQAVRPAELAILADVESRQPRVIQSPPGLWPNGFPPVSISHTHGHAFAAAADPARFSGVGVDIESLRHWDANFARSAFPADEAARLAALPDGLVRDLAMTRLWSVREAAAKSLGLGLEACLTRFRVSGDLKLPGLVALSDVTGAPPPAVYVFDLVAADNSRLIAAFAVMSSVRAHSQ